MATRIKKQNTNPREKEVASPQTTSQKNDGTTDSVVTKTPKSSGIARKIAKKTPLKNIIKKNSVKIKLKAKAKKPLKLNPAKAAKALQLQNGKALEAGKKKLLKNGVKKEVKPKRARVTKKKLPVLEPIFPTEQNLVQKKTPVKKRITVGKKVINPVKKIKQEPDDNVSVASDGSTATNDSLGKAKKPRVQRKPKTEPTESLEDVMNDLSYLIGTENIKKEMDSMSESSKSDSVKPKKLTKKQRLDLLKKEIIKKENIENTLSKLDPSDQKVIDMLDLNVKRKIQKVSPLTRRRHSIEKFSVTPIDTNEAMSQLTLFNQIPRAISPRTSKRLAGVKPKTGLDGLQIRPNPYATRSDSPARTLRNGKHRKLKDKTLLDGLDCDTKKRRRLCSDISNSESMSKHSGYDSDSSFSDLASLTSETVDVKKENIDSSENVDKPKDLDAPSAVTIKRSLSSEENDILKTITDTNSNVCDNPPADLKKESSSEDCPIISPSAKVPEKNMILDSMKLTFNVETEKNAAVKTAKCTPQKCDVDTFYGKRNVEEKEAVTLIKTDEPVEEESSIDKFIENNVPPSCGSETSEEKERAPSDFGSEGKDNEDQQFLENIVKECIESIADVPTPLPTSETLSITDEPIPIIENMMEGYDNEPKEFNEYLDPPQLERHVDIEEINNVDTKNEENVMEIEQEGTEGEELKEEEEIEKLIEDKEFETSEPGCSGEKIEVIEESAVAVNDCDMDESEKPLKTDDSKLETKLLVVEESPEQLAHKQSILKALGLRSLKEAEEAKQQKVKEKSVTKNESYTGTLKTVIKLNRDKKKGRNSLKMTLQKSKGKSDGEQGCSQEGYKIMKEGSSSSSWKHGKDSSDTAGAHRKTHYSNRSNMDGSSEHTSDGETGSQEPGGVAKELVIPEKASSFSIHPGRLCKDECSYCFGKFGLFDTPCHIAQMKSVERQDKILGTEKHLTRDSCLCDACYRHVDRKSNTPSYTNKSLKRNSLVAPGPRQNHCHVLGCSNVASNILRRKWIIKMRKSICQVINIDLDNPGLHSIPICEEHYTALEHLMVCAMCKRRLARNHIHYLGPEVQDLNSALHDDGIPLVLTDKPVVCKLCKCFASIILKDPEERPDPSSNFFAEYKKRLLHFNDIVPMDAAAAQEPIILPSKSDKHDKDNGKKRKRVGRSGSLEATNVHNVNTNDCQRDEKADQISDMLQDRVQHRVPSTDTNHSQSQSQSRSESPEDEYVMDYNTLIPSISMECPSDSESKTTNKKMPILTKKDMGSRMQTVKDAVEISKSIKMRSMEKSKNCDIAVQRLGSNPSISVRQLFTGEEDLPLNGHVDFTNVKEKTPEGWEKCVTTIQYDEETKHLWQELQKPYGNQSSFLRHLILLEKYFRNGDLMLSPSASHHAINYRESVHNRLRAYDNIPSSAGNIQPISMIPFNKMHKSGGTVIQNVTATTSIHTNLPPAVTLIPTPKPDVPLIPITATSSSSSKNAPITLQQLNSPPLIPSSAILQQLASKPKHSGAPPPGLISLHPGTSRPVAPLVKMPQSQKFKFPITKNWRPNLIPIDPTKKQEKKAGLIQVISGGRPYHITLEDYKKMCAIRRSFEAKQKRLQHQETQNTNLQQGKPILVTHNSVLKSITPRKGLIISKTVTSPEKPLIPSTALIADPNESAENILEKLDKQIEKLGQDHQPSKSSKIAPGSSVLLPKIPKSLTVIPQTVNRRPAGPPSPVLLITPKNISNNGGNKSS